MRSLDRCDFRLDGRGRQDPSNHPEASSPIRWCLRSSRRRRSTAVVPLRKDGHPRLRKREVLTLPLNRIRRSLRRFPIRGAETRVKSRGLQAGRERRSLRSRSGRPIAEPPIKIRSAGDQPVKRWEEWREDTDGSRTVASRAYAVMILRQKAARVVSASARRVAVG